ncbi:MAG: hypothetical protein WAL26_29430 [Mycobacterium sp.]
MFAEDSADGVGEASVFAVVAFARLLVAGAVTSTARVGDSESGRASAEHEAAQQQTGTRRNAQSRHPHVLLIPEETVADKAMVVRGFLHTSRHSSVESLLAEIGRPNR